MSDGGAGQDAQETYWSELVLLKIVACYGRRYRDEQAWWINRIGLFKAIVTSGTIGAWAVWKDYAFVWGVLLGAAQILDAAKEYIPQTKNRRNASDFVSTIESIIVDPRFEWFSIFNGDCPADEIMDRWRRLAKLLNDTEGKYFPDGLPANPERQKLAEAEASLFLQCLWNRRKRKWLTPTRAASVPVATNASVPSRESEHQIKGLVVRPDGTIRRSRNTSFNVSRAAAGWGEARWSPIRTCRFLCRGGRRRRPPLRARERGGPGRVAAHRPARVQRQMGESKKGQAPVLSADSQLVAAPGIRIPMPKAPSPPAGQNQASGTTSRAAKTVSPPVPSRKG